MEIGSQCSVETQLKPLHWLIVPLRELRKIGGSFFEQLGKI